jgi:mRNA interferase RelE/StbE
MYELVYSKEATKSLRKISKSVAKRICLKLEKVAKDPYAKNNNLKPLKGSTANYRLRIGDWRVLYTLSKKQIIIVEIATRGEVYKS